MAQFRTPNVAETAFIADITASDLRLRLFTNQVESGLTAAQIAALTSGDFTEATFTGYSETTLTGGSWTITAGDPTRATYAEQTFQSTANQTLQNIWGYYLTSLAGVLRGYRQLDAPIAVEFNLEELRITPILELSDSQGDTMPPGTITDFAGSTAPDGWLLCDGAAVSRTTYAGLFAIIGETYGNGDGSTTFELPDFRQRFALGVAASGTGSTLGGTGGSIDHDHNLDSGYARIGTGANTVDYQHVSQSFSTTRRVSSVTTSNTNSNLVQGVQLGGDSGSNNPPFLAVNKIIKAN